MVSTPSPDPALATNATSDDSFDEFPICATRLTRNEARAMAGLPPCTDPPTDPTNDLSDPSPKTLSDPDAHITDPDAAMSDSDATITDSDATITDSDATITDPDTTIPVPDASDSSYVAAPPVPTAQFSSGSPIRTRDDGFAMENLTDPSGTLSAGRLAENQPSVAVAELLPNDVMMKTINAMFDSLPKGSNTLTREQAISLVSDNRVPPTTMDTADNNEIPINDIDKIVHTTLTLVASPYRKRSNDDSCSQMPVLKKRIDDDGAGDPVNFPTPEEEKYLEENTIMSQAPKVTKKRLWSTTGYFQLKFLVKRNILATELLHEHCSKVFDIFIRKILKEAGGDLETSKYNIQLQHPASPGRHFYISYKTYKDANGVTLMNHIARYMQSNEEISLDESFTVLMEVFTDPILLGRGGRPPRVLRGLRRIRDFVLTKNFGPKERRVIGNSHCLPKSLAIGALYSDRAVTKDEDEKKKLNKKIDKLTRTKITLECREEKQLYLAKQLLRTANMDENVEEHDIDDLGKLAFHLPDYQILLWEMKGSLSFPVQTMRFNIGAPKFIGLFYHNEHYEFVEHTTGKTAARFCYSCRKFCKKGHYDRCTEKCWDCGAKGCPDGNEQIHCKGCNKNFRTQKCYDAHSLPCGKGRPYCAKYFLCDLCGVRGQHPRKGQPTHICGNRKYCNICKCRQTSKHVCTHHIPTILEKEKSKSKQDSWKCVVYDTECVTTWRADGNEEPLGPSHKPNFICVRMFCVECMSTIGKKICPTCCVPWFYSFRDEEEPVISFAKFLLTHCRAQEAHVIAHNGGGYDHKMIVVAMRKVARDKGWTVETNMILNGVQIITLDFTCGKRRLYFRDSLQFIPMGLAKMPAAFGLVEEAKGNFPHRMNHPDYYDRPLPTLPDKKYYAPEHMTPAKKKEFDQWYEDNYHNGFDLHTELHKYCSSDVNILVLTIIAFIQICQSTFDNWNPIIQAKTLASYVMFVMKNMYIQKGDVGFIPENGYNLLGNNNSRMALKYIQWLERKTPGLKLQYKLRGGEYVIASQYYKYFADAYNPETKEVFEIHGCLWHGCPECFPIRDKKCPVRGDDFSMDTVYKNTMQREEHIRDAGYVLHSKWECEIKKEIENDSEMKKFFKLNKYTHQLKPRDSLFGGRTQVFCSLAEESEEYELRYLDFVSMYPFINCTAAYPRGNPSLITKNFPSTDGPVPHRGLVFCDVLPRSDLDIGYLPGTFNERLMFVLCRTCAEEFNVNQECPHRKVSERYLTGVWTTEELNKAISRGYKILKYHEIWFWKDWQTGGFFADYIKPVLALKHQASGWPRSDMKEEEKDTYIRRIEEKDGVVIDKSKVEKNPALRSLCKILLNAAWGKFVQNPIKSQTIMIDDTEVDVLAEFLSNPSYVTEALTPFGEESLFVSRKPRRDAISRAGFTNIPIGSITTAMARLLLMDVIEQIGVVNTLYCDTDSVIFKHPKGKNPVEHLMGEQLGGLTDEIPEGKRLIGFVAAAPKTYALKMIDEKTGEITESVKAKGVKMNFKNAERITYDTMKEMVSLFVKNGEVAPLKGEFLTFNRGCHAFDGILTRQTTRTLKPVMNKGHYEGGVSRPFGILDKGAQLIDDYPFYNL